jgi:hypothetical protein
VKFFNRTSAIDKLAIKKAEVELAIMRKTAKKPKAILEEPKYHTNENAEEYLQRLKNLRAGRS